jgi:transposase
MDGMARGGRARRYTAEFRRDAVALLRASGKPIAVVAKELGITDTTLGSWSRQEGRSVESDDIKQERADREEAARLRKQVRDLEEEIEILKRFTAYWVKDSRR